MSFILPGGLGQIKARGGPPAVQTFTSAQVDPGVNNVFSFSMTSAAGNSGLLLLIYGYPATPATDPALALTIRWAAQTMTRIGSAIDATTAMSVAAFGLVNPTSGAQTLQVTGMSNYYSAATAGENVGFSLIALTGSNTTSVANAFKNWTNPTVGSTSRATYSFPVTSAANNLAVGFISQGDATPFSLSSSSGTVMTNIDITATSGYNFLFISTRQPGAPSSTVSFTWSKATNPNGAMAGLSVSP